MPLPPARDAAAAMLLLAACTAPPAVTGPARVDVTVSDVAPDAAADLAPTHDHEPLDARDADAPIDASPLDVADAVADVADVTEVADVADVAEAPDAADASSDAALDASRLGPGFADLTGPLERMRPFTFSTSPGGVTDDGIAVFGDLDDDGVAEVIASRLVLAQLDNPPPVARVVLRYDVVARELAPDPRVDLPTQRAVVGVVDLDGDGLRDLLLHDRDAPVAWGSARGRFDTAVALDAPHVDVPDLRRLSAWHLDDVDEDGWLDVVTAAACCEGACTDVHVYLRVAPRRFERRPELYAMTVASKPYAVLTASFRAGRALASLGWSCRDPLGAPVFYTARRGADGRPRYTDFDITPEDAAYRAGAGRGFPTVSFNSPMGAAADDVDNDGRLDLVVMLNPVHALFYGRDAWPLHDPGRATGFFEVAADSGRPMIPWGAAFLDLDRDGLLDLVSVHGNDGSAWHLPPERFIGVQHVTAHRSVDGRRFEDVTAQAGLGRRGHFRTLAVHDLEGDGDADLAVGGQFELPRVYRDDVANGRRALALRLRGTTSNHLGVGAWVTVWPTASSTPQHRYVGGMASPYVVSEPAVYVGLGDAASAARVRVTWPSGVVQEVRDLAPGRVHVVTEPALFTVAPVDRRAPADGRSVVRVTVTPRAPDGAPRDAVVEAALTGPGRVARVARTASGWEVELQAPSSPGEAVLELRIDGAPVGVRPRVWWT